MTTLFTSPDNTLWRVFLTIFALIIAAGSSSAQPVPASWQIQDPRVSLHEPVILRLSVENLGTDLAQLDLGANFTQGLLVTIITPEGRVIPIPPIEPNGLSRIGRVRIHPGDRYVHDFVMDQWYAFDSPGRYGIRVGLRYPITSAGLNFPIPESIQTVAVEPRDEAALRRRAEALLTQAFRADNTKNANLIPDADEAMLAMRYLRDPVAIPYLIQALASPVLAVQGGAVTGLSRFPEPQAVNALIGYTKGTGSYIEYARGELTRMAARTQDPGLRRQIQAALSEPQR